MAGLDPAIQLFLMAALCAAMDGRLKAAHGEWWDNRANPRAHHECASRTKFAQHWQTPAAPSRSRREDRAYRWAWPGRTEAGAAHASAPTLAQYQAGNATCPAPGRDDAGNRA